MPSSSMSALATGLYGAGLSIDCVPPIPDVDASVGAELIPLGVPAEVIVVVEDDDPGLLAHSLDDSSTPPRGR